MKQHFNYKVKVYDRGEVIALWMNSHGWHICDVVFDVKDLPAAINNCKKLLTLKINSLD